MKTTISAYDVCRRYMNDNHTLMRPHVTDFVDGLLRSKNVEGLTKVTSLVQLEDSSSSEWRVLMQVEAFFKKNASLEVGIDTHDAAIQSFLDSERVCSETNRRLDSQCIELQGLPEDLNLWLQRMQRYVSNVLGPFTPFLEGLPSRVRVTSGATATRARKDSLPFRKIGKRLTCTHGAAPYLESLSEWFGYGKLSLKRILWNRVVTVPKNWKTDRTIACEPTGNLPLQLAFDTYVKGRLRRRGIDLSDQSRNQQLALEGSVTNSLATVDLSAASDNISFNTVALLLPWEWFCYLNDVRSPYLKLDGKLHQYSKFSSMGNGSTFALETLIFAAACSAVGSKRYSVYGDDIIIESDLYENLQTLLSFLGFTINTDKSYVSGPFRESCGKHYFHGVDVTPFYLRTNGSSKADLCHIVNNLVKLSYPDSQLWKLCRDVVVSAKLPFVAFDGDSTSGVWIHIHDAYRRKLVRYHPYRQVTLYKKYSPKGEFSRICDSRTLFLWYLTNGKRDLCALYPPNTYLSRIPGTDKFMSKKVSELDGVSSLVPNPQQRYVRKWSIHISVDRRCFPDTLIAWTDYVDRV